MKSAEIPIPYLSFIDMGPRNMDATLLTLLPNPTVDVLDQMYAFIENINKAEAHDHGLITTGGDNYLHYATPFPHIFKALLDKCPRERLIEELSAPNYFGETVLHKACQHPFSIRYAVTSMYQETLNPALTAKQKEVMLKKIKRAIEAKSHNQKSIYETLIDNNNYTGLDYLLSLRGKDTVAIIFHRLRHALYSTEDVKCTLDKGMEVPEMKEVLEKYMPEALKGLQHFAILQKVRRVPHRPEDHSLTTLGPRLFDDTTYERKKRKRTSETQNSENDKSQPAPSSYSSFKR